MEYVCRRCGAHFGGHLAPKWEDATEMLLSGCMSQVITHECDDQDGVGLSDLVGFARWNVLREPDEVIMYAVGERYTKDDDMIGYHMHDGPSPVLSDIRDHGLTGSNPNYRILELRKPNHIREIYKWDHPAGVWRKCNEK